MHIEHVNPFDADETVIQIEGLSRPVTIVQVADSHLSECDQRDHEALGAAEETDKHFRLHSPTGAPMRRQLREILDHCVTLKADCVVLAGDIIHFPTFANIEALTADLSESSIPFLYVPGNHDWHYPNSPWNERTRHQYYTRLTPLTCGSPAHQAYNVHGLTLAGIDNSTYQASAEQLDFLRQELSSGGPCLLFMHIPVYVPSLMADVMDRWQAPIMMGAPGWTSQARARWMVDDIQPGTHEFCEFLTGGTADNLAGIFAGHIHIPHTDAFRDQRYQYCCKPAYQGGFRVIRVEPVRAMKQGTSR